jgi:hypothetical protein
VRGPRLIVLPDSIKVSASLFFATAEFFNVSNVFGSTVTSTLYPRGLTPAHDAAARDATDADAATATIAMRRGAVPTMTGARALCRFSPAPA